MITIYKYPFNINDEVTIDLPEGARILKVDIQGGRPCLWAMVDTSRKSQPKNFLIFGTGHPMDDGFLAVGEHVATFQIGAFVGHMFENAI